MLAQQLGHRLHRLRRRLILDEEAPEFFPDELRAGGLRDDQIEDVVTGEVSTAPQECLASLVVLRGVETKLLPLKIDPIAGESAGRFLTSVSL